MSVDLPVILTVTEGHTNKAHYALLVCWKSESVTSKEVIQWAPLENDNFIIKLSRPSDDIYWCRVFIAYDDSEVLYFTFCNMTRKCNSTINIQIIEKKRNIIVQVNGKKPAAYGYIKKDQFALFDCPNLNCKVRCTLF
jgi:hypothetical protein